MADAAKRRSSGKTEEVVHAPHLRWFRATAIAFSLVCLIYAVWAYWGTHFWPRVSDFVSFWAAGRLTLGGHPELAYKIVSHHAAEQAVGPVRGLLPFPYPPPFLAIITPFATLPFGAGFLLWVGTTATFYVWTARRVAPLAYAMAMPPAYLNLLIGQNGFLMSGIFIWGAALVETNPWLAGAILGLMVMKPQLALLLPVAMLAGREWRVIGGAMLSTSALLLIGLLLFGWKSYQAFFAILPHYVEFLRDSRLPWHKLASPFALARFFGLAQTPALLIQSVIASIAAILTARAWWLRLDQRVPILATATILVPPYFFIYDALLLIVPLGWMIRTGRYAFIIAFVWLCAFIPFLTYYSPLVAPNLISVAAIICLWALHVDSGRRGANGEPGPYIHPISAELSPTSW
jgi:hypothetical protein